MKGEDIFKIGVEGMAGESEEDEDSCDDSEYEYFLEESSFFLFLVLLLFLKIWFLNESSREGEYHIDELTAFQSEIEGSYAVDEMVVEMHDCQGYSLEESKHEDPHNWAFKRETICDVLSCGGGEEKHHERHDEVVAEMAERDLEGVGGVSHNESYEGEKRGSF